MTNEIKIAYDHIKNLHPECSIIIFNKNGMWQYLTEDFNPVKFNGKENISILENAANSIFNLPAIYQP